MTLLDSIRDAREPSRFTAPEGVIDGATFALDTPATIPALWGTGSQVVAAEGEPTIICGPDGVGKTSIAQQLMLCRAGIRPADLLGLPVTPDLGRKVLYLAMDRPRQAARSLRRMVTDGDREALEARIAVLWAPPPFDVTTSPRDLLTLALAHNAGIVVIDSLKDIAGSLQDEATAQAISRAMQHCVAAGVEVVALHHQRKAQGDNKRPRTIADVYGSRWLTAGCGSVLMLWGEAGDPIVELTHLKQPAEVVGPLTLLHDNHAGTTTVTHAATDVAALLQTCNEPMAAKAIAARLYSVAEPKENDIAKAKRRLRAAVKDGTIQRIEPPPGEPAVWAPRGWTPEGGRGWTQGVDGEGGRGPLRSRAAHTPVDTEDGQGCTPPRSDADLQLLIDSDPLAAQRDGAAP